MVIANFPSKRLGDVEVLVRRWSNKRVLGTERSVDLNCTPAFLRLRVILDIIATLRNKITLVDVLVVCDQVSTPLFCGVDSFSQREKVAHGHQLTVVPSLKGSMLKGVSINASIDSLSGDILCSWRSSNNHNCED